MKFSLKTILWVCALLASAVATFGGGGIIASIAVLLIWAVLISRPLPSVPELVVITVVLLFLVALLLPAMQVSRESSRRADCFHTLQNLTLALLGYEDRNGTLPPASKENINGDPAHSWRTLILPYIEQDSLYRQYQFDEPWNSESNSTVSGRNVDEYCCISDYSTTNDSSYYAVVDHRTLWPDSRGMALADITDGVEQTILLIEALEKDTPWAEPVDLTFEEAVDLLTKSPTRPYEIGHWGKNGFFEKPSLVIHVSFANGDVRSLNLPLPRELAVALLTCNGGEKIEMAEIERISQPELDWAKIYSFSVFVILSLLPVLKLKQIRKGMAA